MKKILLFSLVAFNLFGFDWWKINMDKLSYYDADRTKMQKIEDSKALLDKFIENRATKEDMEKILNGKLSKNKDEEIYYDVSNSDNGKKK